MDWLVEELWKKIRMAFSLLILGSRPEEPATANKKVC